MQVFLSQLRKYSVSSLIPRQIILDPDSNSLVFVFDFFKAIKNPYLTFFLLKFMEYLTYLTLHGEKVSSNGTQSNHFAVNLEIF